jgi:uncharacterized membrane protein YdjX (TVP38/TMEM64 family)
VNRQAQDPIAAGATRRLLAHARIRAALPLLVAVAALVVAMGVLGHEIEHHIAAIETWIARFGPWAVPVFVALLVLGTSLMLPESVFGVAAGILFGFAWGLVAAVVGNLLAAALQYALARRLLRARIQRRLDARPVLAAIQRAVMRDEVRLQVLLRLTPLNPATVSYLLGAAGVQFSGYLLACLALLPHLGLEVYLGHAGKHLVRASVGTTHTSGLHDLAMIVGLALAVIAIVMVSKAAHRALGLAVAETATGPATAGRDGA